MIILCLTLSCLIVFLIYFYELVVQILGSKTAAVGNILNLTGNLIGKLTNGTNNITDKLINLIN